MKSEKQLYQWDVNQYFRELQPTAEFVDYPMGNEVIRIKADGTRCRIPDEVLQTYGGKTCYERYPDGTFRAYSFSVLYAPKPPDYVYTPEERTTFEALTARVDAAIDEIKRRADSGEFTPVKGVDYFTEEEKNELMESVSDGAIGEFRKVTEEETAKFEATAESELTAYNRNAEEKLDAYNSNHATKVAEYNQNAETKTAEFDSNAAALQTEVDRLRGECDNLAAENRKQENRISALMKLNKGQTYDILPEEGESANRTAPAGAKYVSVDKVGGKSVVEGGAIVSSTTAAVELEGKNLWDDSNPAFMQVLLNAGFVYNSGVWHTNNIVFSSVNIGTIPPQSVLSYDILAGAGLNNCFPAKPEFCHVIQNRRGNGFVIKSTFQAERLLIELLWIMLVEECVKSKISNWSVAPPKRRTLLTQSNHFQPVFRNSILPAPPTMKSTWTAEQSGGMLGRWI